MRKIRFNTNNYGLSTVLFKDRIYTSVMNVTGAKKWNAIGKIASISTDNY